MINGSSIHILKRGKFKSFLKTDVSYKNEKRPAEDIVTKLKETQIDRDSFENIQSTGLYLRRGRDTWSLAFIVQALQHFEMNPADIWIKCLTTLNLPCPATLKMPCSA